MARPRGGDQGSDPSVELLRQLEQVNLELDRLREAGVDGRVGASETRLRVESLQRQVEDLRAAVFGDRGADPLARRVKQLERAYAAHEAERSESRKGRWAAIAAFVTGFFSLLCSLASWLARGRGR